MDTHALGNITIPLFSGGNSTHLRLADLSVRAHEAVARGEFAEVKRVEDDLEYTAAQLWSLSDGDMEEIRRSLDEAQQMD